MSGSGTNLEFYQKKAVLRMKTNILLTFLLDRPNTFWAFSKHLGSYFEIMLFQEHLQKQLQTALISSLISSDFL